MKMSFGAELEFADIDQEKGLPEGCGWDRSDPSMMNSNGIAVDPKGITCKFGGEVQTRPTIFLKQQVEVFIEILEWFGNAHVNHRTNLHIHIQVPGLKKNLAMLKRFQKVIHSQFVDIIDLLEPIPEPNKSMYVRPEAYEGAMKRYRRRKRSHHMFLPAYRVQEQLKSKTLHEFFESEVPKSRTGKPLYHAQPRACVNLRQLLQTGTIEFRHFPGTIQPDQFQDCLIWCKAFVEAVLRKNPIADVWRQYKFELDIPKFDLYRHSLEMVYATTTRDGSVKRENVFPAIEKRKNIPRILSVCLGNVNRSPFMEGVLKLRGYKALSAGLNPHRSKADARAVTFARKMGINLVEHKTRKVNANLFRKADIIVCCTNKHKKILMEMFPEASEKIFSLPKEVSDPHMKYGLEYDAIMNELDLQLQNFLDCLELGFKPTRGGFGLL